MIGFIDIETTGLDPEENVILEVACILVGDDLDEISNFTRVVYHADFRNQWAKADTAVWRMHSNNGLAADALDVDLAWAPDDIEDDFIVWWQTWFTDEARVPMAGNSIHFDRGFLKVHMPHIEKLFHYRNIDVSTLNELQKRWSPDYMPPAQQGVAHRAMADCQHSLDTLRWYRKHLFMVGEA